MDILKAATDWTKAEMFSSAFFVLFGALLLLASLGFWQFGKTDMAKAYVIPTLVAGALLLTIGVGLVASNQLRLSSFPSDYNSDASAFVASEIERVDKTIKEYKNIVFKAIPIIMVICAALILFVSAPIWHASLITALSMLIIIMMIDSNASARLEAYKVKLQEAERSL